MKKSLREKRQKLEMCSSGNEGSHSVFGNSRNHNVSLQSESEALYLDNLIL